MNQTLAIFLDSYRELNARKMFWITLILSALFMIGFGLLGVDKGNLTFATMSWPTPMVQTVYKSIFRTALIDFWLSGFAIILALMSTASVFPELLSGGAVDMYLSKPISRLRLFLTKYVAALLFVVLQATIFAVFAFVVVGVRSGDWNAGIFLTIPLVTLFYSYLFAVCVLFGVLTRSTIAALLLTLLIWFACWATGKAEGVMDHFKVSSEVSVEVHEQRAIRAREEIARNATAGPRDAGSEQPEQPEYLEQPATGPSTEPFSYYAIEEPEVRQRQSEEAVYRSQNFLVRFRPWYAVMRAVRTVLPKTAETVGIVDRALFDAKEEEALSNTIFGREFGTAVPDESSFGTEMKIQKETDRRLKTENRNQSLAYIIGTSLGFEAVMLSLAAWVFCRRDY